MEKIVAGELVVPLAVIDVRKQAEKDADYLMTVEDVLTWEKRFKKLPDNCCVAMMSGWGQHVGNPAKFTGKDASGTFHFPGFSPELAEWLLKERKVLGIASDSAVARQRPVEGLQDPSHLAAVGPLGPGERRQPGKALAGRRYAGGRRAQGEGRHRRTGAADRADLSGQKRVHARLRTTKRVHARLRGQRRPASRERGRGGRFGLRRRLLLSRRRRRDAARSRRSD